VSTPARIDYYELLGVPRDASPHVIRRAYRCLARQHHPDLSDESGAADRFSALTEAYRVLYDPDRRASYDRRHRPSAARKPGDVPSARVDRGAVAEWSSPAPVRAGDVEAILELTEAEAALAATRAITLADARGNSIRLPAGIRHGHRIRIPGAGRRASWRGAAGDLLLTVEVRAR